MQIEGRARVIGDRTAGAVMASTFFQHDDFAGASITVSELQAGARVSPVNASKLLPVR